jgi:hypothetical protein
MPRNTAYDSKPSVCLVACYFGVFPPWMSIFLLSCAHNPTIDFLIVTDQRPLPNAPPNVRFVSILPQKFEMLASEKLRTTIKLSGAYKVCDFKPAYGLLFEELLQGWDYWGYADLDVVYGDIRGFLTRRNLGLYDVFSARREYLVGHFTLFRNNAEMQRLFEQSADIPRLLEDEQLYAFDECGKQCFHLLKGMAPNSDATCDSMTHLTRRLVEQGRLAVHFSTLVAEWPELRGKLWRLRWRNGKLWLVDEGREYMYFHFHVFKRNAGYRRPRVCKSDDAFEITPYGITGCIVEQTVCYSV